MSRLPYSASQTRLRASVYPRPKGIALVFVLLMMSIAITMALVTSRVTLFGEKSARNDRDKQIAFQAAELALGDAELDIMDATTSRGCKFGTPQLVSNEGTCSSGAASRGLCGAKAANSSGAVSPTYKLVDWEETSDTTRQYARFGEFTGNATDLQVGTGVGPSRTPSYVIVVPGAMKARINTIQAGKPQTLDVENNYLVYALGYGINPETRILLEGHFVKPVIDKDCASSSAL
jgi:type IV pilus assembly protein PilX